MRAKDIFKALQIKEAACPAPAAPPKEKPGTKEPPPTRDPGRRKRPNPFRRKDIRPGTEPRPKASLGGYAYEGKKKLKKPGEGKKPSKAFKGESRRPYSFARALIEGGVPAGEPEEDALIQKMNEARRRYISDMRVRGLSQSEAADRWLKIQPEIYQELAVQSY